MLEKQHNYNNNSIHNHNILYSNGAALFLQNSEFCDACVVSKKSKMTGITFPKVYVFEFLQKKTKMAVDLPTSNTNIDLIKYVS